MKLTLLSKQKFIRYVKVINALHLFKLDTLHLAPKPEDTLMVLLDGIALNMNKFHVDKWKNGQYDYSLPVYAVASTCTKLAFERHLFFSKEHEEVGLPKEARDFVKIYLRSLLMALKRFDQFIIINKSALTTSKRDDDQSHNSFTSVGIALNMNQFKIDEVNTSSEEMFKDKAKGIQPWDKDVREQAESLNIKLPTLTKGLCYVTKKTTDWNVLTKLSNFNNIVDVTINNYETMAIPTTLLRKKELKQKQQNAYDTALNIIKQTINHD